MIISRLLPPAAIRLHACWPLYIATPRQWETHNMSPRQAELINAQLNGLQIALAEKGIPLLFREVDDFVASVEIVKQVCAETALPTCFITISMK